MSHEPIPLKVTNSFYYIKNSVKPMPYVMWGNDLCKTDMDTEKKEPKDNMKFLNNFKKNIKK